MSNFRYRDAATGEYVSEDYARANPATTVREAESPLAELEARVAALESAVSALTAMVQVR